MPSLSKAEKDFIKGSLVPSPDYRYVLIHRIKKKREEMLKEIQLIDAFLKDLEKKRDNQKPA